MKKKIVLSLLMVMAFTCMNAKRFYDSKSQIIGISGNINELVSGGFTVKFLKNDIPLPLEASFKGRKFNKQELLKAFERERTGKKLLDMLFQFDGNSLSEDLLKERALQNVQLMDDERANVGVIDKETILKEDYLPILQNNYIFLTRKINIGKSFGQQLLLSQSPEMESEIKGDRYKVYWIVFKVMINKEILDQVFNCWNNIERYNQIDVPIEYVASGSFKETDAKADEIRNLLARSVQRKVEAFAIRGQVIDNHPLMANIGIANGLCQGDRMNIYRQAMNKEGKLISAKIASARAGNVEKNKSRLFAISGSSASYKKGDIAVLRMDRGIGQSISYNTLNLEYDMKCHGITYTFDKRQHFSKLGISTYYLVSFGLAFDKSNSPSVELNKGIEYDETPMYIDPGIGIGLGKTFFSRMEIMPYLKIHYMIGIGEEDDFDYFSQAVRVPVGVQANVNLFHPLQLTFGMEYNFMLTKDGETWGDSDGSISKGFGLHAGLRIVF